MYWLTGKRKSKRWPPVKTYVVIFHLRNRPFTRLHKNKKHTVLKSEMIFWGSQGVKLGWKQQPYKIRVRPCEALIQLYHISSKYKGNLEHMNIHHTWGNWANIMQVYLCRYLSSLSYVRVYGQCIYSPLPLAASRWLFDATNWHFLIIAHQQPQHFCWESNFFPRASVVFRQQMPPKSRTFTTSLCFCCCCCCVSLAPSCDVFVVLSSWQMAL